MGESQETAQRLQDIFTILQHTYPHARCALHFTTPLELLIATILAAQCTDERVNQVTPSLFRTYPTASDYATVELETLATAIRSTGFYRQKARSIQQCCTALMTHHGGVVPATMEALTRLPGVGRKTANVVLGNAFERPEGIAVDTHVKRVAQRLQLTSATTPEAIETDLLTVLPQAQWTMVSHLLILHGRTVCKARTPQCTRCPVAHLCPSRASAADGKGAPHRRQDA